VNGLDIAARRLHNAGLTGAGFATPEQVVRWFGAVQAQDYGPAKWSLGQRCAGVDDQAVAQAFADGRILRTHILRPTWHFVLPDDIRWIQELTAPRVQTRNTHRYRQLGLDEPTLAKSTTVMIEALRGGRHLVRRELAEVLAEAGIDTDGQRLAYLLMNAELNAVICSGAPDGRQHTYALLDERAPAPTVHRSRDQALAELTMRYFASHGPATVNDFAWWSSLTVSDIRAGLDLAGAKLRSEVVDGLTYWSAADAEPSVVPAPPSVLLVQAYDEYVVAFRASKHLLDASGLARSQRWDRPVFTGIVLLDGQLAGHWKRTVARDAVMIETYLYVAFDAAQRAAMHRAATAYGEFLELALTLL